MDDQVKCRKRRPAGMIDGQAHGEKCEERHKYRSRYGGAILAPGFQHCYYIHKCLMRILK